MRQGSGWDGQSQRTSVVHRSPQPEVAAGTSKDVGRRGGMMCLPPRKETLEAAFARDVGLQRQAGCP